MNKKLALSLLVVSLAIIGCAGVAPSPTPRPLEKVTLALPFIPNVQFSPFYVAAEKGYFAEEGIEVQFEYGSESDFLQLVGTDELQFMIGSGEQVILARAQGVPVVYVLTWWRKFPVAVFSLEKLDGPQDLVGMNVGIPGFFGASYIGWKAMLYAAGIPEEAVKLDAIGFTQVEAVTAGQVEAAVGYAVNEPVQLQLRGYEPSVIRVSDYFDLVANGLVTNEQTVARRPELVQGMVRASLRGIRDAIQNPEEAFDLTLRYAPEAAEQREAQMAVLRGAIKFWEGDRLGYADPAAWEASVKFMRDVGLIETSPDVAQMVTNRFVEAADVK